MVELWLAARPAHVTSPGPQCLHLLVERPAADQQPSRQSASLLALTCRNLPTATAGGTAGSLFSHAIRLHVKGGLLSIATQELLLALQPSPPGLDHGIATWHTSDG